MASDKRGLGNSDSRGPPMLTQSLELMATAPEFLRLACGTSRLYKFAHRALKFDLLALAIAQNPRWYCDDELLMLHARERILAKVSSSPLLHTSQRTQVTKDVAKTQWTLQRSRWPLVNTPVAMSDSSLLS